MGLLFLKINFSECTVSMSVQYYKKPLFMTPSSCPFSVPIFPSLVLPFPSANMCQAVLTAALSALAKFQHTPFKPCATTISSPGGEVLKFSDDDLMLGQSPGDCEIIGELAAAW